jgi:hypothetical protein
MGLEHDGRNLSSGAVEIYYEVQPFVKVKTCTAGKLRSLD